MRRLSPDQHTRLEIARRTSQRLFMIAICLLLGATSGCVNITAELTPHAVDVGTPLVEGSDCAYIIFGFGFGTATVDAALARYEVDRSDGSATYKRLPPITRIHSIRLHDYQFLGFGARCVEVIGTTAS